MYFARQPVKKILLTLSLVIFTLMLATNALATSGAGGLEQDAGPYHVIMQTNPETLTVNQDATFTVIVEDETTGKIISGAKVMMLPATMGGSDNSMTGSDSDKSMAGMDMSSGMDQGGEAMQEQSSMGSMAMDPGSYMMEGMSFNQPGQWIQPIAISSPLGDSTVNFPLTVAKSGPNYLLIGGVAGVVVIAGILAALLKKKKNN